MFVSFFRRTCIKILEPFKLNQLPNGKSSNRYYNCTNTNSAGGIHIFYKSGDVTDINNYRAIALSSCLSKSFESLILTCCKSYDTCHDDDYQFGYKKDHSTSLGCATLKHVVDYYMVVMFLCAF